VVLAEVRRGDLFRAPSARKRAEGAFVVNTDLIRAVVALRDDGQGDRLTACGSRIANNGARHWSSGARGVARSDALRDPVVDFGFDVGVA